MINYEIFEILRTFSKPELVSFGKYLNSPYFGERKKLGRLYSEIMKYYPLFNHVNLSRHALNEKLFRTEKLKESTLRNLFSDLYQAALGFLEVDCFGKSNILRSDLLFTQLKLKNLNEEFYKLIARTDYFSEEKADWIFFLNRHFTESHKFNFSYHNARAHKVRSFNEQISFLDYSAVNLLYFFLTELISRYINFIIFKISYNTEGSKFSIEKIFRLIDMAKLRTALNGDKNVFMIDIYAALINAFSDFDDEDKYFIYKDKVKQNINRLSENEKSSHYYKLVSYCSLKTVRLGPHNKFDTELFSLYNEMLDEGFYIDLNTKHLPRELFRNILMHGLRLKEYGWVHDFVVSYSPKVHPNDRENILNYGFAYLNYNTGNYEKSLNHLNKIRQDYFVFKVDIKNLMLMIYYELGYTEEGLSLLKSYREFIRKDKLLSKDRQKRYQNFAKFLEKLSRMREGSIKTETGYINRRLRNNNDVAFKDWLLEKVEMLEAKSKKAV